MFSVAHDLLHSTDPMEHFLAESLLATAAAQHWTLSHKAHHAKVHAPLNCDLSPWVSSVKESQYIAMPCGLSEVRPLETGCHMGGPVHSARGRDSVGVCAAFLGW